MQKKYFPFVIVLLGVTQPVIAQELSPKDILQKTAGLLREGTSFAYKARYSIKYFDNKDTLFNPLYRCEVLKAPGDTVLGYYAHVHNDSEERVYDGERFLLIWHGARKVTQDNPVVNGKRFAVNNIKKELIPAFIYSSTPFESYIKKGSDWKMSETRSAGKICLKIELSLPSDEDITSLKKILYIDKTTLLPVKLESFARYKDIQDEYYSLELSDLILKDEPQKRSFTTKKPPQNYAIETYVPVAKKQTLLPDGTPLPQFSGKNLRTEDILIGPSGVGDKLLVLDFWYLACAPCLQAMPAFSKLYDSYKEKGLLLYGLNPMDDPTDKLTVVNSFISKLGITYPLLFIDKSISEQFLITTYPTVYLIKKGKIIYSKAGYSAETFSELEKLVSESLVK